MNFAIYVLKSGWHHLTAPVYTIKNGTLFVPEVAAKP